MHTLGVLAPKGGVGKSTVSIHLAVLAKEAGLKVALLDTDHPQGSLTKLAESREATFNEDQFMYLPSTVSEIDKSFAKAAEAGMDFVIVDGTPNKATSFQHFAPHCDIVLSPVCTSPQDRMAIQDTLDALPTNVMGKLYFLLNKVRPKRKGVENHKTIKVRELLTGAGLKASPVALTFYTDFEDSLEEDLTVFEYSPKGQATQELIDLWNWIIEELNNG